MVSSTNFTQIDQTALFNYLTAQVQLASAQALGKSATSTANSASSAASSIASATAADNPPWNQPSTGISPVRDAQVMSLTNFIDLSKVPPSAGVTVGSKTEQDNQKLFAIYTALNNLNYLAGMATRTGVTPQLAATYNARFQTGMQQVEAYIKSATFNNFTLQLGQTESSVTSAATVPISSFSYTGGTVVSDANVMNALPNVSSSQSFTIAVTKGGSTTNVAVDLSQVQGPLTLGNIISYADQQLAAAGFSSRLSRVMTQGSLTDLSKASYGISVTQGSGETLSFSSAGATPSLYLAGSSGSPVGTSTTTGTVTTTTAANQQGRLIKLTNLSGTTSPVYSVADNPTTGTTTANATAVDSNGNVYTVGTATGNFGSQINQGTQDVVLNKYDSAGNLLWTRMLGSTGTANGYSLAIDANNNVIVSGSTTGALSDAVNVQGQADSFVAKYDSSGTQAWVTQLPAASANQANSVSVDASGNIYIGGQTNGVIASGQTSNGGKDGYVAKLSASGKIQYEQQIGTSGTDTVAATTVGSDGSLYVASVQNGNAILTKYANGDATSAPVWSQNLGALGNGGSIGGLTVSNGKVWISGSTSNAALNSGGQATVNGSAAGGMDAFVAGFTDNGASVTANTVTYVGTSGSDTAGALTTDANGNVYLTGTTTGTFAGQSRTVANTPNAFVTQLNASGQVNWTQQIGGASGISTGGGIAIDTQGSSVLDALGLPRGTISINQSVDLASATTLRAGDSFQIKIDRNNATSTRTVTIDPGETMGSLARKISTQLVFAGTATVSYGVGGAALKISVNSGVSANFIAGPSTSDALARLGIPTGTIANGTVSASSGSTTKPVYALGIPTVPVQFTDVTSAKAAQATLKSVLTAISNAYRTSNNPAGSSSSATGSGSTSGTASSYLNSQLASYQLGQAVASSTFNTTG